MAVIIFCGVHGAGKTETIKERIQREDELPDGLWLYRIRGAKWVKNDFYAIRVLTQLIHSGRDWSALSTIQYVGACLKLYRGLSNSNVGKEVVVYGVDTQVLEASLAGEVGRHLREDENVVTTIESQPNQKPVIKLSGSPTGKPHWKLTFQPDEPEERDQHHIYVNWEKFTKGLEDAARVLGPTLPEQFREQTDEQLVDLVKASASMIRGVQEDNPNAHFIIDGHAVIDRKRKDPDGSRRAEKFSILLEKSMEFIEGMIIAYTDPDAVWLRRIRRGENGMAEGDLSAVKERLRRECVAEGLEARILQEKSARPLAAIDLTHGSIADNSRDLGVLLRRLIRAIQAGVRRRST